MKTYESERKELFEWLQKETSQYYAAVEKDMKEKKFSKDSEHGKKQHETEMEYNRRLLELKRKYKIK